MRSFHGIATALLAGIGLVSSANAGSDGQVVAADAAPPAWVAYAEQVNTLVTGWLAGEEPAAVQLRADLDATRAAADQSSSPINLKLWIDAKGTITRAEADPITPGTPAFNLTGLLVGRAIGAVPPKRMLLPLRLAAQLDSAPLTKSAVP